MLSHLLNDGLLLLATRILTRPFFASSIETPPFAEHLAALALHVPEIRGCGDHEVAVESLAGSFSTELRILHWRSPEAPTLVWHHGGGERPFDLTVAKMYPADQPCRLNVIAVRAPFQRTPAESNRHFQHLHDYLTMLATAVKLTEVLFTTELAPSRCKMMGGYSVGGIISNRHRMTYASADLYFPFMAGTRHADIFLTAVHVGAIAKRAPGYLAERLDFDGEWAEVNPRNVFPVLARWDLLNRLKQQGPSYGGTPYEVWNGGHLYGVSRPHLLREKIEQHLTQFESSGRDGQAAAPATACSPG